MFQLLRFGTLLLISIVFAKAHITIESIGNYELFLFITALFSAFWINSLIQAFLPLYKNNTSFTIRKKKSPEFFNAFILLSAFSIITLICLLAFKGTITRFFTESGKLPFFDLLLIYIFFSSPAFLVEYIYLLQNKPKMILMYGITTFSAQFVLVSLPVIWNQDMKIAIWGLVIISVIRYLWLLVLLQKHSGFNYSLKFISEHLQYAWPLIISTLIGSSATYVDGFLVIKHFDASTFAIFRYGAKEFPLVVLMANALSTAMISDFSNKKNIKNSLDALKKRSTKLMHTLFPVTILFLVGSYWLYPVVFNPDFAESATVFNIYLLLIISRLVFPQTILLGLKKSNIIMYASFAELSVNVLLSILFIRWWGIEGVAFATVVAFTVQKIIWVIYNQKILNIIPNQYIQTKVLGYYSVITMLTYLAVTYIEL